MKPNILIPMAGLGNRFVQAGFKIPKQLITIKNQQLIDISMNSIAYQDCNLIFIVRDEMVYNFNIDVILKKKFGDNIEIIVIDHLTQGSVCSCLYAKHLIDNDVPLIIHTLDIEFRPVFDPCDPNNFTDDGLILTFKSNSSGYSYAKMNDQGYVQETAEKKAISDNACVGIYAFTKGSDFVSYANEMINENNTTKGEFYIAPLYNYFIKSGKKIVTRSVNKMHIFGTPEEYYFYKDNVVKKLGDKPIAICSDHSGFEMKEHLKVLLDKRNLEYIDFGPVLGRDCDYRDFIELATKSIQEKDCNIAFGFCRTGQGVNICANKFKGIRSALIYNDYAMEMAIRHNCANFFAIPSKDTSLEQLENYLELCKIHTFDGGRHQKRIQELE